MLTFKELEIVLHKWAHYFSNREFEHWELINAVWLKGDVQKLKSIKLASARVRFDMIDYMRSKNNYRVKRRYDAAGKFFPQVIPISTSDDKVNVLDTFESRQDYSKVETDDLFDKLLIGLLPVEKLIIHLRYKCDFTLKEIAKVIGFEASRCSQIHTNTIRILKRRLIDLGEVTRQTSIAFRNSDARRREYNRKYYREYYEKHKVQIRASQNAKRVVAVN